MKVKVIGQLEDKYEMSGRVYDIWGVSPSMLADSNGGDRVKKILVKENTKRGYSECDIGGVVDLSFPNSTTRRGRVQEGENIVPTIMSNNRELYRIEQQALETFKKNDCENGDIIDAFNQKVNKSGVSPTVTTRPEGFKTAIIPVVNYRIRKLTPKECWRLMDFTDDDFEKAEAVNSNSQLYKQAGNSIVKNVLVAIIGQMIEGKEDFYKNV